MPEAMQSPIAGKDYRFLEDGFMCGEWPDPVRYGDVTSAALVPGSASVDITFTTPKGKRRKESVILESRGQEEALQALLRRKLSGASVRTRPQTAWEACGTWVTAGMSLAALVVAIILLNTAGRGATVSVPVFLFPFIVIGSFLSVEVLAVIAAAILVIFGVGALLALRKRKTVWEIAR